jgi:hypothetical protein
MPFYIRDFGTFGCLGTLPPQVLRQNCRAYVYSIGKVSELAFKILEALRERPGSNGRVPA